MTEHWCSWPPVAAVVAILAVSAPGAAHAQTFCSRPVQPACSSGVASVDTEQERRRCLEDIERYIENLGAYGSCLDQVRANAASATEAADRFRACLGEGRNGCSFEGGN